MPRYESSVDAKNLALLRSRGAFAERIVNTPGSGQRKGLFDIIACYKGLFLGVEDKRNSKAKRAIRQMQCAEEVEYAGGIAVRIDDEHELERVLDAIDRALVQHTVSGTGATIRNTVIEELNGRGLGKIFAR